VRNREFETLEKKSVLAISKKYWDSNKLIFFLNQNFANNLTIISEVKNLPEHWDLPNTEIFCSNDVSVQCWNP
jgi:hypothetical protein